MSEDEEEVVYEPQIGDERWRAVLTGPGGETFSYPETEAETAEQAFNLALTYGCDFNMLSLYRFYGYAPENDPFGWQCVKDMMPWDVWTARDEFKDMPVSLLLRTFRWVLYGSMDSHILGAVLKDSLSEAIAAAQRADYPYVDVCRLSRLVQLELPWFSHWGKALERWPGTCGRGLEKANAMVIPAVDKKGECNGTVG